MARVIGLCGQELHPGITVGAWCALCFVCCSWGKEQVLNVPCGLTGIWLLLLGYNVCVSDKRCDI